MAIADAPLHLAQCGYVLDPCDCVSGGLPCDLLARQLQHGGGQAGAGLGRGGDGGGGAGCGDRTQL